MNTLQIRFRQRLYSLKRICKVAFLLLLTVAMSISVFALSTHDALNWQLDTTVSNVDFYHAITKCNGKTVVFLRFINKNRQPAKVSWEETITTQMRTEEKASRGKQQLTLAPGETMAQDCSVSECKACVIMPDQVNPTYLAVAQDFSFKNISVKNAN